MRKSICVGLAVTSLFVVGARQQEQTVEAQTTSWFRSGFDNPGTANRYEFGYFYGEASGSGNGTGRTNYWSYQHLPNGDYDGSGAAHLTRFDTADQYTMGWAVTQARLNRTFRMGDSFYLRYRIRFDDNFRFQSTPGQALNGQTKFLMMGNVCAGSGCLNSRTIVLLQKPTGNYRCTLGANPANPGVGTQPQHFGLAGSSWADPSLQYRYGSFSSHVNIDVQCAGPALVTYGNNTPISPGPGSQAPQNGWYFVQVYVRSGDGNGEYKLWVNNNAVNAPTQQINNIRLGVDGWHDGFVIGGQITGPLTPTSGYRLGAAEIGPSFDPNWYPGAGASTPPEPPSNLRIIS